MSAKIFSGGALMLVARWTRKVSGLVRGEDENSGEHDDDDNQGSDETSISPVQCLRRPIASPWTSG